MEEDLDGFGDAEPAEAVREAEGGHGVVAYTSCEDAERAGDGGVGVAADDELAWLPEATFDDGGVGGAAAAIEDVFDAVLRGEFADGGEGFGGLLRGGCEVVVEGEGDARGVFDLRVLHFVFEDLHDEVGAEVVDRKST